MMILKQPLRGWAGFGSVRLGGAGLGTLRRGMAWQKPPEDSRVLGW
jgi:hypothetical protein